MKENNSKDVTLLAAKAASDKKASEVLIMDMQGLST